MSSPQLSPTSYLVLGLIALNGAATSYDLKSQVSLSVGNFWSFPHSQLYAEPEKLTAAGYLDEEREETGRRRRIYSITPAGRDALLDWVRASETVPTEVRDVGLLKLFFSVLADADDRRALAERELESHRAKAREYEALAGLIADEADAVPWTVVATLDMGREFEHTCIRFWEEVLARDE